MTALPKDVGRLYPYYEARLYIYRTRIPTVQVDEKGKKRTIRYKREFVALIQPLYFKEKREAQGYVRQFAYANRSQGMYDWDFAVEWLGVKQLHAKEDLSAPNNGHSCPRCHRMTNQGGAKDLCESCSKLS